jgi:hypothetical protein
MTVRKMIICLLIIGLYNSPQLQLYGICFVYGVTSIYLLFLSSYVNIREKFLVLFSEVGLMILGVFYLQFYAFVSN